MKHDVCLRMAAAVTAVLLLASCRLTQPVEGPAEDQTPETGESARTGTLLMDFTSGSNVEDVRPVELEQGIAMSELCSTLEEITGIQFDFAVTMDQAGCTVTWQERSALIQGETLAQPDRGIRRGAGGLYRPGRGCSPVGGTLAAGGL